MSDKIEWLTDIAEKPTEFGRMMSLRFLTLEKQVIDKFKDLDVNNGAFDQTLVKKHILQLKRIFKETRNMIERTVYSSESSFDESIRAKHEWKMADISNLSFWEKVKHKFSCFQFKIEHHIGLFLNKIGLNYGIIRDYSGTTFMEGKRVIIKVEPTNVSIYIGNRVIGFYRWSGKWYYSEMCCVDDYFPEENLHKCE